uniref:AAA-type ATPase N-terminal domain-containing protein n=1 Tax=Aegilops tauschii TaxID=37682 RepID=M8BSH6_AEGTA
MMGAVLDHLRSSAWYYLTAVLATCARIGVVRTYFNQYLRRPVRRLLPFLDPFVTIDIAAKPEEYSFSYQGKVKSSDAYAEWLAYLSAVCSREARELRAEGAGEGHGFVLSLREGQVVADDFKGVTMSWSAVAEEKTTTWRASGRCCRLTLPERHRRLVVDEYLPHVRRAGQEVMFGNRPRRLYSNKKELSYHARDADACLARLIDQLKERKAAEEDKESKTADEDDEQNAAKEEEEDKRETEKVASKSKSKKEKSEACQVVTNGAHTGASGVSVSSSTDSLLIDS